MIKAMRIKKGLGLLLVFMFIFSMVACSNSQNGTAPAAAPAAASAAAPSAANTGVAFNSDIPESAKYVRTMDAQTGVYGDVNELGARLAKTLGRKPVVLVASNSTANDWSLGITNSCSDLLKSVGCEVINTSADRDNNKHCSDIETGISRKVDGIVVIGGVAAALEETLKKVKDAGIPVVTTDVPSDSIVTNVTADNFSGSAMVAMKMCMDLGGKGNIVVAHVSGWHTFDIRRDMLTIVLSDFPGIKIINEIVIDRSDPINSVANSMESLLQKYPKGEIDAVYTVYGLPAMGAANAIQKAGRTEIGLYDIDADKVICKDMMKGNSLYKAACGQSIRKMGETDAMCLLKAMNGEEEDMMRQTFVPFSLVTPENAELFGKYNYADFDK